MQFIKVNVCLNGIKVILKLIQQGCITYKVSIVPNIWSPCTNFSSFKFLNVLISE